jgi:hypothetical protein
MLNVWFLVSSDFSPKEAWGEPSKMSGLLLLTLRALRQAVGYPCVIHCGYELTGHTSGSQHHIGNAADFHFEGISLKDAIPLVEEALDKLQVSDRVGLGVYIDWAHPGFHLDVRGTRARWGRVGGKYVSYAAARAEAMK